MRALTHVDHQVSGTAPDPTQCWAQPNGPVLPGFVAGNGWTNTTLAAKVRRLCRTSPPFITPEGLLTTAQWDFCAPQSQGAGIAYVESSYDFADPDNGDTTGASFGRCYNGAPSTRSLTGNRA